MHDELGLASSAFQRHDCQPRCAGCDLRAKVAPHNMKTQIQPCRGTCGRQNSAVVHVQHIGIDIDFREAVGEFVSGQPMRRRFETIQRSGTSKQERASANRSHSGAACDGASQLSNQFFRYRAIKRVNARHNNRVSAPERREWALRLKAEVLTDDFPPQSANTYVIWRQAV